MELFPCVESQVVVLKNFVIGFYHNAINLKLASSTKMKIETRAEVLICYEDLKDDKELERIGKVLYLQDFKQYESCMKCRKRAYSGEKVCRNQGTIKSSVQSFFC